MLRRFVPYQVPFTVCPVEAFVFISDFSLIAFFPKKACSTGNNVEMSADPKKLRC